MAAESLFSIAGAVVLPGWFLLIFFPQSGLCHARLKKLGAKSETTRPRILQQAIDSFEDAKALEKIASDKVLIAENHVRKVIHEEYAPTKHERMRRKCLPSEKPDSRPFSF